MAASAWAVIRIHSRQLDDLEYKITRLERQLKAADERGRRARTTAPVQEEPQVIANFEEIRAKAVNNVARGYPVVR